ncbi:hypothetical protein QM806_41305, partial [Rhodococcus sp. IEGM 1351]|uniref:hypothetical protein n=1 Tax=Rhodococcus sp. IEGM 1351 TaxID=3047089 RepID=UPI0024B7D2DE
VTAVPCRLRGPFLLRVGGSPLLAGLGVAALGAGPLALNWQRRCGREHPGECRVAGGPCAAGVRAGPAAEAAGHGP